MARIVEYLDEAGISPFGEWFAKIDANIAAKVRRSLARMENGNFGDAKGVGAGVVECRIDFGPGYRIYFGRDGGDLVVLLAGGTKRRQQADIGIARTRWADYKARKKRLRQ
jgi:putative addiction module killer protein